MQELPPDGQCAPTGVAQPETRLMAGECSGGGGSLSHLCSSAKDVRLLGASLNHQSDIPRGLLDCERAQMGLREPFSPAECMNLVHQASSF